MEMSGFVALLAAIIVSRIINERGYRLLSADEKLRLMDGFSRTRAYALIPLAILIGAFYFLATSTALNSDALAIGYFVSLIGYIIVRAALNQRKLTTLQMPISYRKYFMTAQAISMLGVAWFFYTIFNVRGHV
jgi:hypothetical protein